MALNLKFDGDKSVNIVDFHTCSNTENKKRNISIAANNGIDVVFVKNDQLSECFVDQNIDHKREKTDVYKYYLINRGLIVDDDFITKDFLEYRDEFSNTLVQIGARCVIKLCVENSKIFVEKLLEYRDYYTKYDLVRDILPKLLVHFNGALLQIINTEQIDYLKLEEKRSQIDKMMLDKFSTVAQEYGVKILQFKILQFLAPLKSTAVHAVPFEVVTPTKAQIKAEKQLGSSKNSTPMSTQAYAQPQPQVYAQPMKLPIESMSKEILALMDDKTSVLVDKSLDKIQMFLDDCIAQFDEKIIQASQNLILPHDDGVVDVAE